MSKGNPSPSPKSRRKPKPHKVKSIKLAESLCPIAENSLSGTTSTIEFSLALVDYLAKQAIQGDEEAIGLLAKFGVEAQASTREAIIVYAKDGSEAAWIC